MVDMSQTIAPKSDQLNADDLIGGPRTITVTRVTGNEGNAEQPVNVFFDGDNGKAFRPCKSMRRVMVKVWGADASKYAGRSMTLFRDPKVKWGGMEVGGIRISHMTGIDKPEVMALTESKQARRPYTVQPLKVTPKADKAKEGADALIARINAGEDISGDATVQKQIAWLRGNRPELAAAIDVALSAQVDDDPFAETPAYAATVEQIERMIAAAGTTEAIDQASGFYDGHRDTLPDDVTAALDAKLANRVSEVTGA